MTVTQDQRLLLQIALGHTPDPLGAWQSWRSRHTLEGCADSYHGLFPMLFRALARVPIESSDRAILKGVYRFHWTKNLLLAEATGQALAAVQQAGLDALVLNGLATAQLEFSDLGLRPTHQAELLVRPQQRDAAVAILQAQQWRPLWPVPQSGAGYRCQFANPQQARLSLHWFASLDSRWTGADELCWTHSREFRLHQQPAHALSAASALLHTCVRGTKHKGPDSLEWLLDASMLLASHPDLDWPGVLREARYRRQELHLQRALAILQSLSKVTPPPWVVESLQATPASLLARLHFHFNASPPRSWSFLLEPLVEYERTRPPSRPASLLGLLDFLRARWRLRHFWQVPARLIQSLWRRPS